MTFAARRRDLRPVLRFSCLRILLALRQTLVHRQRAKEVLGHGLTAFSKPDLQVEGFEVPVARRNPVRFLFFFFFFSRGFGALILEQTATLLCAEQLPFEYSACNYAPHHGCGARRGAVCRGKAAITVTFAASFKVTPPATGLQIPKFGAPASLSTATWPSLVQARFQQLSSNISPSDSELSSFLGWTSHDVRTYFLVGNCWTKSQSA